MNPYRSGRAWLPSAIVAVVFTGTLGVLQTIFRLAYDDSVSRDFEDSTLEWLFTTNIGFWGPGAFDIDQTRALVANLVAALVLLLVTFLVSFIALRGIAPGSSALSAFLIGWAAAMVAAPVASVADMLVQSYDELGDGVLGPWLSGAVSTSVYGFKWGWLAALVATVVWIAVRPRPESPARSSTALPEPAPSPAATTPTTTSYPESDPPV